MRKKKISIILSPQLLVEMSDYVEERGRSQFIEKALKNELQRIKKQKLTDAYRESEEETEEENRFFEGVNGDGIS
ncbi:MAG: hypothetical protein GY950_21795 [bacterium]|nr:hypothetical protein [bacterium]